MSSNESKPGGPAPAGTRSAPDDQGFGAPGADDAGGTRRQKAQATAEQLLAAARETFEVHGFKATTVAGITARAGCAHGTFYLYFQNKEDAFAKVMASVVDEMEAASRASWNGDVADSLRRSIEVHFQVVTRHRGLWRCLMEGFLQSPAIEAMWLDLRRPFVDRLERVLLRLDTQGQTRPLQPRATAIALANMVEWTAFTVVELGEPGDVAVDDVVDAVVELWHRAVYLNPVDGPGRSVPSSAGRPRRERTPITRSPIADGAA